MITPPDPALFWVFGALLAALAVGSVARVIGLRHAEEARRRKRLASLRTWWILTIVLCGGLLAGVAGVCLLLIAASCIAWREYTAMLGVRSHDQLAIRAGYGFVLVNYGLILFGLQSLFVVFLPVGALMILAVLQLSQGDPAGYIRSTGGMFWGMMFLIYGVSHAALLFILPEASDGPLGAAGWFLFLVILTESNDIFQALVGRLFGAHKRHPITPAISPNKTWQGFVGGLLITLVLAILLAPLFTSLGRVPGPFSLPEPLQPWVAPVLGGTLIAIAGFFGDINMSAIKRDSGVKDSSGFLPGMGGLIDRIDSLTITAPVFTYFLVWWMG